MKKLHKALIAIVFVITVIATGPYAVKAASGFLANISNTLGLNVEGSAGIEDDLYVGEKVGIGTTSPTESLDVVGKIKSTQGLVFDDGTAQTTAFIPGNTAEKSLKETFIAGESLQIGSAVRFGNTEVLGDILNTLSSTSGDVQAKGTDEVLAQTFVAGSASPSELVLYLERNHSGYNDYNVFITPVDGALKPVTNYTSNYLFKGTKDADDLSNDQYPSFNISSANLTSGTIYAIVLQYTYQGRNGWDNIKWKKSNNGVSAGGKFYIQKYLGSWDEQSGTMAFSLRGSYEDTAKLYKASAADESTMSFVGFSRASVSSGQNVSIDMLGVTDAKTGLSITDKYVLSDTAGEITKEENTSEYTIKVPVGVAINSSNLYMSQLFPERTLPDFRTVDMFDELSYPQDIVYNNNGSTGSFSQVREQINSMGTGDYRYFSSARLDDGDTFHIKFWAGEKFTFVVGGTNSSGDHAHSSQTSTEYFGVDSRYTGGTFKTRAVMSNQSNFSSSSYTSQLPRLNEYQLIFKKGSFFKVLMNGQEIANFTENLPGNVDRFVFYKSNRDYFYFDRNIEYAIY